MEIVGYTFGLRFFSDLNSQDESSFIDLSHGMWGSYGYFKKWGTFIDLKLEFDLVRIIANKAI